MVDKATDSIYKGVTGFLVFLFCHVKLYINCKLIKTCSPFVLLSHNVFISFFCIGPIARTLIIYQYHQHFSFFFTLFSSRNRMLMIYRQLSNPQKGSIQKHYADWKRSLKKSTNHGTRDSGLKFPECPESALKPIVWLLVFQNLEKVIFCR